MRTTGLRCIAQIYRQQTAASPANGGSIFVAMEQPLPPSDMSPAEFRKHGHAVIDWIADYLEHPDKWPVLPSVRPGELRRALPQSPPKRGEEMGAILEDFQKL